MTVIALAPGSGIFAAFLVVFFFAVVYGLYTVTGSAISERPYSKIYGGAPGASGSGHANPGVGFSDPALGCGDIRPAFQ